MSALSEEDRDDDESQWRFAVDEVGEDAETPGSEPIEPGTPTLENSLFVLVGVTLSLLIFYVALGSL
ncbi:DUF7312 domain-containing protein [Haloplanus halophilus]|uniref:DUF7312 domain-containing protein n=1 Tax=Haloplanus halophilus TaxID=2949993 RepID=UPI002040C171|nr:hypothetical protein [Haloplanus sp. GDY1]